MWLTGCVDIASRCKIPITLFETEDKSKWLQDSKFEDPNVNQSLISQWRLSRIKEEYILEEIADRKKKRADNFQKYSKVVSSIQSSRTCAPNDLGYVIEGFQSNIMEYIKHDLPNNAVLDMYELQLLRYKSKMLVVYGQISNNTGTNSKKQYLSESYLQRINSKLQGYMLGLTNEIYLEKLRSYNPVRNTFDIEQYEKENTRLAKEVDWQKLGNLDESSEFSSKLFDLKQKIESNEYSNHVVNYRLGTLEQGVKSLSPPAHMPDWALSAEGFFDEKFLEFLHIYRFKSDFNNFGQKLAKYNIIRKKPIRVLSIDQRLQVWADKNTSIPRLPELRRRISQYILEKEFVNSWHSPPSLDPSGNQNPKSKTNVVTNSKNEPWEENIF